MIKFTSDLEGRIKVLEELVAGLHNITIPPPKLKKKIIDLSCIGSDIDMEFSNDGQEHHFKRNIGKLLNITPTKGSSFYSTVLNDEFYKCRIRENHWHHWNGDKCPLPEGFEIEIEYYDRDDGELIREGLNNYRNMDWSNISGFKVLGTTDDAIYEWQKDNYE